jgi:hypothetical protein
MPSSLHHYYQPRRTAAAIGGGPPAWLLSSGATLATLDIDLVNDRAYNSGSTTVASLLTCTRASTGYYTSAAGALTSIATNTLRYGDQGLLEEAAATNLILRSQEHSHAAWDQSNAITVTADQTTAPDGTSTADLVVPSTSSAAHSLHPAVAATVSNGATYTASVYVKPAGYTKVGLVENQTTGFYATYLLSAAGSVLDSSSATGTVTALANGWYRITHTSVTGSTSYRLQLFVLSPSYTTGNTLSSWAANGTSGVYVWGAQLETGESASSYIPTTGSTAARAADVVEFSNLAWFDGASDSIFAEWTAKNVNNAKIWAFDATNDKLLDEQTGMSARIAGATVGNTSAAGLLVRAAARMAVNDFAIAMCGEAVATDVSETAPGALTASRIGCDLAGANFLNGYVRRVAAWKGTLLDDAALQSISVVGNDDYTTVLLHFDGADAATTFTDSNVGGSAHTWTAAGNAQLDTAAKEFGSASLLLDGTGDSISTPAHADVDFGSGDFTVDLWFNRAGGDGTTRGMVIYDNAAESAPAFRISLNASNQVAVGAFHSGGNTQFTSTSTFTATGWNHVAFVRTGNTLKLFINGTQEGGDQSYVESIRDTTPTTVWIGQWGANRFYFNGWIDEVRISKGLARWTANFTPSSSAYGYG